jgi:prefoldin subunit 5
MELNKRKIIAFFAVVVITAGAIAAGSALSFRGDEKVFTALTAANLLKNTADLQKSHPHLFPTAASTGGYTAPFAQYIEFGEYPQTHVSNAALITSLNSSAVPTGHQYLTNGSPSISGTQTWSAVLLHEYAFGGAKYVKMPTTKPQSTQAMSTGVNNNTADLWFRVEPLRWFVTANDGSTLSLLAVNGVISGIPFHNYQLATGYSTYFDSGVRAFLIGDSGKIANLTMSVPEGAGFLQTAFNAAAQGLIKSVTVENNTDDSSRSSPYTDSGDTDTADKVYLPSYDETMSLMNTAAKRKIKPTDFALANYAYYNTAYTAVPYLLRSAYSHYMMWVAGIDNPDSIQPSYAINSLRPALQISISGLQSVSSVGVLTRPASSVPDRVTVLESEMAQLKTRVGALEAEKTAMQAKITALESARGTMQNNITNLQTQLNAAKTDLESKINAAQSAATNNAKTALNAEVGKLNNTITGLNKQIADLNTAKTNLDNQIKKMETDITDRVNKQIAVLTQQLTDYITAHADDYKYGFNDGHMAYVNEYGFVTWKILLGNEHVGGNLTTYVLHDKVNTPYGTQIQPVTLPKEKQTVSSKQYTYTFAGWSLTPQMGAAPNTLATFPKTRDATDVVYYAQYTRAERKYNANWIIPSLVSGNLSYATPTKTVVAAHAYGSAVTVPDDATKAAAALYGNDTNYVFNGCSSTQ